MQKHTKKALMLSVLSLVLCVSMLVGTTFAWFTDSVTTGVNTIQSGTLDIVLEYSTDDGATWNNAEGKTLNFQKAAGAPANEAILWEPGCTYALPMLRLRNNGNLALKYNFVVNGVDGDAKLLEAIEWKIEIANNDPVTLANYSGTLLTKDAVSDELVIMGHMKEEAGNEYQGLEIKGIGITVFATQMTHESDSFNNQYDKMATIDDEAELAAALAADYDLIVLGADIELTEGIVIPAGKTVTIDLAGFDIKQTKACTASYEMIGNNGTLTIKDSVGTGRISFTDTGAGDPNVGWASYTIRNSGTLTVESGIIEHLGTQPYNGNNAIFHYNGTTTINGGKIEAPYSRSLRIWNGSATINGGAFDGQVWVQSQGNAELTINDGSFKPATHGGDYSSVFVTVGAKNASVKLAGGTYATKVGTDKADSIEITGGTYAVDPTAFVADGYMAVENANGTYTVVEIPKAATTAELEAAISKGGVVQLTADVALSDTLMNTKDVTIDLNGHKVDAGSSTLFQSQSNAAPNIIITSSKDGAEINVSGGDTAVLLGYGSTVIENVTINVTGCDNYSPNPFNVYGDLTLGEDTVVNVDYLGTALINNNGKVAVVIDGAKINVGTFKTNGTAIITLNQASTLEIKDTDIEIDNFVLSPFGGDSLVSKVNGVTIEDCTFDVTDSNGASCTFEAKDGKYRLVQN